MLKIILRAAGALALGLLLKPSMADGSPVSPKVEKVANFPRSGFRAIYSAVLKGERAWFVIKKDGDARYSLYSLRYEPGSTAPWTVAPKPLISDLDLLFDVIVVEGQVWFCAPGRLWVAKEASADMLEVRPYVFARPSPGGVRPKPYRIASFGGKLYALASDGLYRLDKEGWTCLVHETVERPYGSVWGDPYSGDILISAKIADPDPRAGPYGDYYRYRKDRSWARENVRASEPPESWGACPCYAEQASAPSWRIYHPKERPRDFLQVTVDGKVWTNVAGMPTGFTEGLIYLDRLPSGLLVQATQGRFAFMPDGTSEWLRFDVPKREHVEGQSPTQGPGTSILVLKGRPDASECELYWVRFNAAQ